MEKKEKLNQVVFFDYKDTKTLAKFLNPHARILQNRRSQLPRKHQRAVAQAIKNARYMGLLPYVAR